MMPDMSHRSILDPLWNHSGSFSCTHRENSPGREWGWMWEARRADSAVTDQESGTTIRSDKMARLEAVLFVAESALSARKIAQLATLADAAEARFLIEQLNAAYEIDRCAFRVDQVGPGYRLLTQHQYATWLGRLHDRQSALKLSPAAMETLTIIAYRQPVIRTDVEAIRGVQCSEMIKQLMEQGLVRIAGEADMIGRPYLFATTPKFLESFGLKNLDAMPMADQLRRRESAEPEAAAEDAVQEESTAEEELNEEEPITEEEHHEEVEAVAESEEDTADFDTVEEDAAEDDSEDDAPISIDANDLEIDEFEDTEEDIDAADDDDFSTAA